MIKDINSLKTALENSENTISTMMQEIRILKEKIELIHDYAVRSHRIFGKFIYG